MPVFKNEGNGTWYVMARYVNWKGERKQKCKRGLDTRVSLKQALAAQGFKGGSHGDTERSQWVQSEKENLAAVMGRHGIEWEHKGTHEKHLS